MPFLSLFSLREVPLVGVCCLLLWGPAQAQTSVSNGTAAEANAAFVEGTIVTTAGDSLQGQVQWKSGTATPETIRFRTASTKSDTTYSPAALQSVRLEDGRRLVSRAVTVDQVPTDPKAATRFLQSGQEQERPDTLLLEVLADGPLALYAKLGQRNHYYVEREDDIEELLNRRRYVEAQNAVATRRRYREQLGSRMQDCPEAQNAAGHLRFRTQKLKALVTRYNRCVGETKVFERADRPRFATTFGLVGGAMRSEFALSNVRTGFNSFGWGTGGKLGASMTTRLLRTNRHWAFHAELVGIIQRIEATVGRQGRFLGNSTLSPKDFVEMSWAKSFLLMRYHLSTATWSPYAEAGFTAGYLFSIEAEMPDAYASLADFVLNQNRFTPGVAIGAGLQYRSVQVGLRTELTSAWASYTNFKSRVLNVSVSIGYQF